MCIIKMCIVIGGQGIIDCTTIKLIVLKGAAAVFMDVVSHQDSETTVPALRLVTFLRAVSHHLSTLARYDWLNFDYVG